MRVGLTQDENIGKVKTDRSAETGPRKQVLMFETSDVSHDAETHNLKKGAASVKLLAYLPLIVFVSAIALIYKSLLHALIYVMARLYPKEFDRDAAIDALTAVEKDSTHE